MGTVTGIDADDVLNVRAEASYDSEFIGELLNGAQVEKMFGTRSALTARKALFLLTT